MKNLETTNRISENKKIKYVAPAIEIIEIESEGVLCGSGDNVSGEGDKPGGSIGDLRWGENAWENSLNN